MPPHKWQFASRFRRNAFGWKSDTPIQRIKEALTEIKQVARKEPILAAEGAVTLLEKLSPALEQVDSSSGAIGSAVNRAIEILVPIIAKAEVDSRTRQRWLERLWQAIEYDGIPYIESLGEYWGELCAGPELAAAWADDFVPTLESVWSAKASGQGYFKGTRACLAALYAAGRHEQLLALLELPRFKWWPERYWGVRALLAMGQKAEALQYAEQCKGQNAPLGAIAQTCEEILLSSGMADEAYCRYAIEANQGTTNLATFRALVKKYPHVPPTQVLRDLIASTPGGEGKWFAAAKDAGLYDLAIELVTHSPTDPRTLTRAARDFGSKQPGFAIAAGLAALRWISLGHGYDITGVDVRDAYDAVVQTAANSGMDIQLINEQIQEMATNNRPGAQFLATILGLNQAKL